LKTKLPAGDVVEAVTLERSIHGRTLCCPAACPVSANVSVIEPEFGAV
jgi:hypothetical protein